MPMIVEIENPAKFKRVRTLLGAKSDAETLDRALEKVIDDYEPIKKRINGNDLPEAYWEDLFSDPPLPRGHSASQAIVDERNEDRF